MLMKRRSSPLSSTSRSLSPGNWRSRSATTSSTVPPLADTSALPFVTWRSGVGMRTVTGIVVSLSARLVLEIGQRAIEGGQRGLDLHVRLRGVHLRLHGAVDQAERLELLEGLPDLGDQGAARAGHNNMLRCPPAQLLGDLVAERLGAFRVVRPEVHVHERPAVLVSDLRAEAVHLVVGAVHGDQGRVVDERAQDLAL